MALQMLRYGLRLPTRSVYTLADLADDTAGLLDALGLPSAHVCGASMGGMVAQHMAARHPRRVRSLSLMMTTSGARSLPGPTWRVRNVLLSRPSPTAPQSTVIDHFVKVYRLIGSPAYPAPLDDLRARVTAAVQRSYRPESVTRQLLAIAADGDRSRLLGDIQAPTQVIHGRDDPLVPVPAGHDLKARIRNAEIDVIDGMGHDLPQELWPRFAANVRTVAGRA